jgi:hypothetical protein
MYAVKEYIVNTHSSEVKIVHWILKFLSLQIKNTQMLAYLCYNLYFMHDEGQQEGPKHVELLT